MTSFLKFTDCLKADNNLRECQCKFQVTLDVKCPIPNGTLQVRQILQRNLMVRQEGRKNVRVRIKLKLLNHLELGGGCVNVQGGM